MCGTGCPVARHEREPLRARVEAVPAQTPPDAVRGYDDPAPTRPRQLRGDPARSEAGMGEREGDDPLLDDRRELVRHPRPAPLPWAQHLQPVPVDLPLPGVVGRTMNTESTTGSRDADPAGEIEQLQPVA